jgi:hypothetical protein
VDAITRKCVVRLVHLPDLLSLCTSLIYQAKLNEVESEAQLNENNVEHQQSGPSLPFSNTPSVQNVCYSNFCRN